MEHQKLEKWDTSEKPSLESEEQKNKKEALQMKFPESPSVKDDLVLKRPFHPRIMEKMKQIQNQKKEE